MLKVVIQCTVTRSFLLIYENDWCKKYSEINIKYQILTLPLLPSLFFYVSGVHAIVFMHEAKIYSFNHSRLQCHGYHQIKSLLLVARRQG